MSELTLRQEFPIFNAHPEIAYLDSAASTQKPRMVIDRIQGFYESEYATINRGLYELGYHATNNVAKTRDAVRHFIGAKDSKEIIFTSGTTAAINLVANSLSQGLLKPGQEILISQMEHHANIVPLQRACDQYQLRLKICPITSNGELDMDAFKALLGPQTGIVALTHISNVLGCITPIKTICHLAHEQGAYVLIDGAQAVAHVPVNVQEIDCDFYCFSSHKLYGPSGVGVLYGKANLLEAMPVYQSGGDMIETVSFEKTTYADLPNKFEAGTPPIAQIVGLGAAIEFVSQIGFDAIQAHDEAIQSYAYERLSQLKGIQIFGPTSNKSSLHSFVLKDAHPHDIATILDQSKVCIRAGHHCAQPLMSHYEVAAMARASYSVYNTSNDIDQLISALSQVIEVFQ
ncbi:MAG: cysteine desulfurase CsdA [Actinobacteria bacterium]|nr:cysteine desulfurase CsdA [Actinomycetota bacterium]